MTYSIDFVNLIKGMLESSPEERLKIEEVFRRVSSTLSKLRTGEAAESAAGHGILLDFTKERVKNSALMKLCQFLSNNAMSSKEERLELFANYYAWSSRSRECRAIIEEKLLIEDSERDQNPIAKIRQWMCLNLEYYSEGNTTESEAALSKALELCDQINVSNSQTLATLYRDLGEGYTYQGKFAEAERMFNQSLGSKAFRGKQRSGGDLASPGNCLLRSRQMRSGRKRLS